MLGLPSGSSMWSALPWSAVTTHTPPLSCDDLEHRAQALVDRLYRRYRGRDHAGVTDHVGVGEVDDPESKPTRPVLAPSTDERGGGLAGAHLRLVVVGGHVARGGHQLAPLAAQGVSSPPLKK